MNELKVFKNENFGEIRTTEVNGEPMFCLIDVARALGYSNPSKAVIDHCKGVSILETPTIGGMQSIKFGKESEVYRLTMKSKTPNAEQFQDWVCEEVLPTIRKTGGYMTAQSNDTDEDIMARALLIAQDTIKRKDERIKTLQNENLQQAAQIEADAPKIIFANAVMGSKNSCLIGELAKIISQNGYTIGQNRLFEWLRSNGYLGTRGEYYNIPNQQYIEQGLFELKKGTRSGNDGMMYATITTKVTQKGCQYFINKFIGEQKPSANTTETEQHS